MIENNDINHIFIGREYEQRLLSELNDRHRASLITVYGRRRVGKTELIERVFQKRGMLKFEGIHGLSEPEQIANVLWQLSEYKKMPYIAKLDVKTWREVFKLIFEETKNETSTVYFEEIQWLANYEDRFVADLKYAWDNFFKKNDELILILCGSSPSFIINHIIKSKTLYNRSQLDMPLKELSLCETKKLLAGRSSREVMDAYLMVGGIPEYLNWLNQQSSVFVSFCNHAFRPGGLLLNEYEKIFISSFSDKAHYKQIIEYLAKNHFATRREMLAHLKLKSSGTISAILEDLEICGFIEKYAPYNLNSNGRLSRYCITDAYLQMYYKFIRPQQKNIERGDFIENPLAAIQQDVLQKWMGFAFERFCRKNHRMIAKILGFSGVRYQSGTFYSRKTDEENRGYQLDLIFDRDDHVITLCEIKYLNKKASSHVIEEMESKIEKFQLKKNKTIQRVLVCNEGAEKTLIDRHYFDHIISLDDLFQAI